jgi:hypothetical protein
MLGAPRRFITRKAPSADRNSSGHRRHRRRWMYLAHRVAPEGCTSSPHHTVLFEIARVVIGNS